MRHERGQALVELAIFGSLLIMLVGALINYGLNYDYQQQAAMESFRKALGMASAPLPSDPTTPAGSATTILIKDRHIPNPAHPFATGSLNPITGSASVTRNFALQENADAWDWSALPYIALQFDGAVNGCPGSQLSPAGSAPPCKYLTSGFRLTPGVSKNSLDRYREVYGGGNVCAKARCGGSGCKVDKRGREECDDVLTLLIVDPCDGEIINYEGCIRQARLINNPGFCIQECERGKPPDSDKNCLKVCTASIQTPWYANGCVAAGSCPPLDNLFTQNNIKSMGVQPGYVKEDARNLTLQATQGTSTTSGTWTEKTTRTIMTQSDGGLVSKSIVTEKPVPVDGSYAP